MTGLTEEPLDLAARVRDKDGKVWVSYMRRWTCLTAKRMPAVSWRFLVTHYAPLQLMPHHCGTGAVDD